MEIQQETTRDWIRNRRWCGSQRHDDYGIRAKTERTHRIRYDTAPLISHVQYDTHVTQKQTWWIIQRGALNYWWGLNASHHCWWFIQQLQWRWWSSFKHSEHLKTFKTELHSNLTIKHGPTENNEPSVCDEAFDSRWTHLKLQHHSDEDSLDSDPRRDPSASDISQSHWRLKRDQTSRLFLWNSDFPALLHCRTFASSHLLKPFSHNIKHKPKAAFTKLSDHTHSDRDVDFL